MINFITTSWGTILAVFGIFVGIWATLKYVILVDFRIDINIFKTLYDFAAHDEFVKKLIVEEEVFTDNRHPALYKAFIRFKNYPLFYLNHSERILQAGWDSKDYTSTITCFRWNYKKMRKLFTKDFRSHQLEKFGVPVEIIARYWTDKIGSLKKFREPIIDKNIWEDIETDVARVLRDGEKTGAILYGPPGNGKTSFVKYLAGKYNLPIKIVALNPEYTNTDIMLMFSQITSNCIVLFEDFDNLFDKRNCTIGQSKETSNNSIKFTFDAILNSLDGVFNNYEKVIFVMTVNDIEKVDVSLKHRPSRFKFVRKFDNPNIDFRTNYIGDWAEKTEGLNLDQIMRMKEFKELGFSFEESYAKIVIVDEKKIEEKPRVFEEKLSEFLL